MNLSTQTFAVNTPHAWLRLDTMVVEKTDYLTGRNVRYLRVDTPDLPSSQLSGDGGGVDGNGAAGVGGEGAACTPPPRENGEGHFGSGGSGGSGGGATWRRSWSGKQQQQQQPAPPQAETATQNLRDKLNSDRLFGEVSSSSLSVPPAAAGSNGVEHR